MKNTIKSTLTKAQIEKFTKLQDEAIENSNKFGYYTDEFDYCLGRLAEDLCDAGDKKWARRIYKIVENSIGVDIQSVYYCNFADDLVINLGDKEWARKIYKKAEEDGNEEVIDELAVSVIKHLGDKEWARKIYEKIIRVY